MKVLNNTLYNLFNVFWSKLWNISATNYLYHGHTASCGDIKLDEVEARELLKNHQYLLSLSSLSYRSEKREGEEIGRYVLHVGVIEKLPVKEIKEPHVLLPKVVTYETPTKKVDIPVQVVKEGPV